MPSVRVPFRPFPEHCCGTPPVPTRVNHGEARESLADKQAGEEGAFNDGEGEAPAGALFRAAQEERIGETKGDKRGFGDLDDAVDGYRWLHQNGYQVASLAPKYFKKPVTLYTVSGDQDGYIAVVGAELVCAEEEGDEEEEGTEGSED